jgi:hypothetical protein
MMQRTDPSVNGILDSGCTCSVCRSFRLEDFTQLSWYTALYNKPNSAILETNEPPRDEQLPSLRANYLEAITEFQKVDRTIRSIRLFRSDTISRHAHLQKVVEDYRLVLSPIRRVPFEIVRTILENIERIDYGCAMKSSSPDLHVEITNGPWRFSKVCRLWRAVAIQSPEFWCDIRIRFALSDDFKYSSSGLHALLNEGVRRCALRGLRVSLEQVPMSDDEDENSEQEQEQDGDEDSEGEDEDGEDEDEEEAIIHVFSAHSSQIRMLDIEMEHSSELNNILCSLSCSFTSLQCLSIQVMEECDEDHGSNILEAFKESPSLTELRLIGIDIDRSCRDLNFPWHQLQLFKHIHSLTPEDVVDVVRLCPRLQKYIITTTYYLDEDFFTVTPSPVHHTELTHLELSNQSLMLLRYTTIPSLRILHVEEIDDDSELTELVQFITRSQCSIQDLDFSPVCTSLQYNFFFESLPSLTRFTPRLRSITQLNEFLLALTSERLPRLVELSIWVTTYDPLTMCTPQLMSSFIHLIQSRSSRLHSFTFYPRSPPFKFAAFKPNESRCNIDMLRALLVPHSQKLRAWIQGGMRLYFFIGAFPRFDFHVYVAQETNCS